jgi:glycosyltransferase involved in cell wall biosynthesis
MNERRATVLVIMNIPTPYRVPLFAELARQLRECGYHLKVAFGGMGYDRRKWIVDEREFQFDYVVLPSRRFRFGHAESVTFTYSGLYRLLRFERPVVTVVIGFSPATMKLWLRSFFHPMPYVVWAGTILSEHLRVPIWRRAQRRLLIARAAAYVAYGSRARDYLISLGAPSDRVHIAINTVDTEFFRREARRLGTAERGAEFLYVGHMTEGKRVDLLLRAFQRVVHQRGDALLTLVGDGPSRAGLETLAHDLGIASRVRFEGFRQRDQIPGYLARACGFVFPSEYDIWGLVLVEALAAGVPCIASVHAGATRDLIEDDVTGFRADFSDVDDVARKMLRLLDHPERARRMGEAGSALVRDRVNLKVSAAGLVAAVKTAAGEPLRRAAV